MLQTQRYGIQVSRKPHHKQTNKQTNQQTTIPAGRGTASGNKPNDYYNPWPPTRLGLNEHVGFNYRISNFRIPERVLSIKRAAQDATFDPENFIQALVTSCFFLLRKSAQNPFIHTVNTKKNTQKGREYIPGGFSFLTESKRQK